jgi:hypothetical protein
MHQIPKYTRQWVWFAFVSSGTFDKSIHRQKHSLMKAQIKQYLEPLGINDHQTLQNSTPLLTLQRKDKFLVARLIGDENQKPLLEVYDTNYSKSYAKRMLKKNFEESGLNLHSITMFARLREGDILLSNHLYGHPAQGDEFTLPYHFEYSGLYGAFLRCSEKSLGSDWEVRFLGSDELTCEGAQHPTEYLKYQLLNEL